MGPVGPLKSSWGSPLLRYITAGFYGDPEHASNRAEEGFRSFFISSLERVKKQLKSIAMSSGHTAWQVINPLWILAGPTKLPRAEILALIEEGWVQDPVRPSKETYRRIATSLLAYLAPARLARWCPRHHHLETRQTATEAAPTSRAPGWVGKPQEGSKKFPKRSL